MTKDLKREIASNRQTTYPQCFQFTFPLAKLLLPTNLRFSISLQATFKLVDLLPPIIKLLSHITDPLAEIRLSVLASLLEVCLDLTEGFQPSYEIIVEDTKVSKGLGFSLASLLNNSIPLAKIDPKVE